jgi:hypothetical protein
VKEMDEITLLTVKVHLGDVKKRVLEIGLMADDEKTNKDEFWNQVIVIVNEIESIDEVLKLNKVSKH